MQKVYFPHGYVQAVNSLGKARKISAKTVARNKVLKSLALVRLLHYNAKRLRDHLMPAASRTHKIGYARVSTPGQNLDSQLDALKQAGCSKVFTDQVSGTTESRPGWDQLLAYARPGDTVVVAELSRMTRSLMHLLQVVKDFEDKGIELISLRENIDTSTVTGRCFLSLWARSLRWSGNLKQNEPLRAVRQRKRAVVQVGARAPIRISFNEPVSFTRTRKKRPRRFAGPWVSAVAHSSVTWQLRKIRIQPWLRRDNFDAPIS